MTKMDGHGFSAATGVGPRQGIGISLSANDQLCSISESRFLGRSPMIRTETSTSTTKQNQSNYRVSNGISYSYRNCPAVRQLGAAYIRAAKPFVALDTQ